MDNHWYYFEVKGSDQNTAGVKAPDDISKILNQRGAQAIHRDVSYSKEGGVRRGLHVFKCMINWILTIIQIPAGSTIVIQHPYDVSKLTNLAIRAGHAKKIRFISMIHDISSLRGLGKPGRSKQERSFFSADYLIVHNAAMKQYLIDKGCDEKRIFSLELFDYLMDSNVKSHAGLADNAVIIAGNLSKWKSSYIYQMVTLDLGCTFRLYGPYFSGQTGKNVDYRGSFSPDDLPNELQGSFGLVWDGDSVDTCSGSTGHYLRYNNPHKVSLYLATGIPVIVWKEAAVASFVEKYHVGCCISSLREIPDVFNTINKNEYQEMLRNVSELSEKLRRGYFTNKVFDKIILDEKKE